MIRLSAYRLFKWRRAALAAAVLIACTDPVPTAPKIDLRFARGGASGGPTVKSTNPSSGAVSTTLSVHVIGSSFEPGSRAIWALKGDTSEIVTKVKTNSTTFVSSTELLASITIGSDASLDLYDVVVITPQGKKGIGIELFTVTAQIIDLGAGDGSRATGVNNLGQVVGQNSGGAFLWEGGVIRLLGTLPGMTSSSAEGINDNGQVIGYATGSGGMQRAFIWTASAGMQPLAGTLGGSTSEARAINVNGDVAGSSSLPGDASAHAAIWRNGVISDLQAATFSTGSSYAWGINDAGAVVGQYNPVAGGSRSFRWTEAGGMELIVPYIPNGDVALGVGGDGVVIGWRPPAANKPLVAYRWTNGVFLSLGTLGGSGSVATATNNAGAIVGRADTGVRRSGAFQHVGFIWTAAGGMKSLGLPSGRDYAQAWDINDSDWVAGETSLASGPSRATLWKLH